LVRGRTAGRVAAQTVGNSARVADSAGILTINPLSFPAELRQRRWRSEGKGTQVEKWYYVYMLASRRNGTLYTGLTSDLAGRVWQHKNDVYEGFTNRYGVHILVWYEAYDDVHTAIAREKQLKKWNRAWKIRLIEKENSGWNDLYEKLFG